MAPTWPPGAAVIDLTDDDDGGGGMPATSPQNQSTIPRKATRVPPPAIPRIASTTPVPVPQQPRWSTTPILPPPPPAFVSPAPLRANNGDPTLTPAAKRQKIVHDYKKYNERTLASQVRHVSQAQQQQQQQQTCTPVPVPKQPTYSLPPGVLRSIENADDSHLQTNRASPADGVHERTTPVRDSEDYEFNDSFANSTAAGSIDDGTTNTDVPTRPPSPPKLLEKKPPRDTVQRQKARARAHKWQGGRTYEPDRDGSGTPEQRPSSAFGLETRPYLSARLRRQVVAGSIISVSSAEERELGEIRPQVLHVDFADDESRYLRKLARTLYGRVQTGRRGAVRDLRHLLKKDKDIKMSILGELRSGYANGDRPPARLLARTEADVENYLQDLVAKHHNASPLCLRLEPAQLQQRPINRIPHLLFARETTGRRGFDSLRRCQDFTTAFQSEVEDYLEPRMEFTNCAGDVATICWLSENQFICGTTTHSDSHNQQYNKPGNLALGNVAKKELVAYPEHRIPRPIVSHGDNALDSMRQSQDPWLFTSVVSSDYSVSHNLAFTSSFDHTVRIWECQGSSMESVGTWHHGGRVNFVVASSDTPGKVATATDVPEEAVRVYKLEKFLDEQGLMTNSSLSSAEYKSYSCSRITDEDFVPSDKWAYFPASIRWGIAEEAQKFLLVGYSPRSRTGVDDDIPEDKLNTGELCVFDTQAEQSVKVYGAATQNVFDVIWHPTQVMFAAATSLAPGLDVRGSEKIKTQIRLFQRNTDGVFYSVKTLDCPAMDINMLTIRPNSKIFSYVTASCTNSRVYVWDSARDDRPICVLKHGDPIDEILGDREQEDVGVTFTAWGSTADRLYTGSSDGVVKVWNIRHGRAVLVKDLIELQGPITCGAFSRNLTKLAIGDATGKVCIMTQDEANDEAPGPGLRLEVEGMKRSIRRPRPITLHPEVPAPGNPTAASPEPEDGPSIAANLLQKGALIIKPGLGVFQGPNYSNTGLYRRELHLDEDPTGPLLARHQAVQQTSRSPTLWPVRRQRDIVSASTEIKDFACHTSHLQDDFAQLKLDEATEAQLRAEGAEYDASKVDYVLPYDDEDWEDDTFLRNSSGDEDDSMASSTNSGSSTDEDDEKDEDQDKGSHEKGQNAEG